MSHSGMDSDGTFGAMYIGAMITLALYGITAVQAYFYYMYYPRDTIGLKLLVAAVSILDTLHTALVAHVMYYYLVTLPDRGQNREQGVWSLFTSITLNVVIAFMVQTFYTMRIAILCPQRWKWWVTSVTGIFVLLHFGFGISTAVQFFNLQQLPRLTEAKTASTVLFAVTTILSDILIAISLCVLLDGSKSSFSDTNSIINKLMIYAINRCVLIAAVAIAEVIAFRIIPNTYYAFAIDFLVGKLYTNALLSTLNCRRSLRSKWDSRTNSNSNGRSASTTEDYTSSFNLTSLARGRRVDEEAVDLEAAPSERSLNIRRSEGRSLEASSKPLNFDESIDKHRPSLALSS